MTHRYSFLIQGIVSSAKVTFSARSQRVSAREMGFLQAPHLALGGHVPVRGNGTVLSCQFSMAPPALLT